MRLADRVSERRESQSVSGRLPFIAHKKLSHESKQINNKKSFCDKCKEESRRKRINRFNEQKVENRVLSNGRTYREYTVQPLSVTDSIEATDKLAATSAVQPDYIAPNDSFDLCENNSDASSDNF